MPRSLATVAIGVTAAAIGILGGAAPASALYRSEPEPQQWTAPGPVHAVVASGGRVYVGFYNGDTLTGGIAALSAISGELLWSTPTNGDVRALALSSNDARLMAGGRFTSVDGLTHRRLVALSTSDGAVVTTWRARAGGAVRDLAVDGDMLYVGGQFGALNGTAERGLGAVLVSTGRHVDAFSAFVDKNVYGLAISGSRLIVSGNFTLAKGEARRSLASFDLTTGALTPWAPARICSDCNSYWDIAVDARNVYVGSSGPGGQFAAFDLETGRQPWHYLHTDGDVQAVTVAADGLVYLGGHFNRFVGSTSNPRTLLAAVNASTGGVVPGFAPKLFTSWPGVWGLSASASTLFAGGNFTGVLDGGRNDRVPYLAAFAD